MQVWDAIAANIKSGAVEQGGQYEAKGPGIAPGPEGVHPPSIANVYYFMPLLLPALLSVPGPTLPWPDGLRATPLLT